MKFPYKKVHFVGIGGIGMSALARILVSLGVEVTGSDISEGANVEALRALGVRVWVPHNAELLPQDAELVVYSSAIPEENPELVRAKDLGIPIISRGRLLAMITEDRESVVVAGSHGKTTTTAMVAKILWDAGLSPTVIVGGRIRDFESANALMGSGSLLVAESDESDGSFLMLHPEVGVLTNIDREHLNYYGDFDALKRAFRTYLEGVRSTRVICMDDENALEVSRGLEALFYSASSARADVFAESIKRERDGSRFVCRTPWGSGEVRLKVPGHHNVLNALAAVAASVIKGCSLEEALSSLSSFKGVERRLTLRGYLNGAPLIDDYAHHPTEISSVLDAVRQMWPERRIIAVFQPHRYSRMKYLWRDFIDALSRADLLFVSDVYSAGERENSFSMDLFLRELSKVKPFEYYPHWSQMEEPLKRLVGEGDLVITLGAGDVWKLCLRLADRSF